MNEFIKNFKNGLAVKVDPENIKKFLEIIQYNSKINWVTGRSPMGFNPFLGKDQVKYLYIFYNKKLNGMQVFLYRENVGKEIYDFHNFELGLEENEKSDFIDFDNYLNSLQRMTFDKSIITFLKK